MKSLTALGLASNQLQVLPTWLGELRALTELNLRDNRRLVDLPRSLSCLKKLQSFTLQGTPLAAAVEKTEDHPLQADLYKMAEWGCLRHYHAGGISPWRRSRVTMVSTAVSTEATTPADTKMPELAKNAQVRALASRRRLAPSLLQQRHCSCPRRSIACAAMAPPLLAKLAMPMQGEY
eukprot:gnl/TRDRNA2_/TRDRNA2_157808_c2_seq1.p2 gnl/TRDRNA2_/TRDRNA2_157808_c2~~gnl/TRDRNA2_/TRDRNA2_157808_c2_seq1.p2  ORF type:complete len:178 (+),score=36.84 gnl/TRDRNA2_/TRDRNA2_157808_c2_seq1:90-623(+)